MKFNKYFNDNYNLPVNDYVISRVIDNIGDCIDENRTIYVAGNGGSAYTANHFVQDLNKACGATKAISLSENIGLILAVANDISFEDIFEYQLRKSDFRDNGIFIAISCSGNSKNILKAAKYSTSIGIPVIGFTGNDGGELGKIVNWEVNIPTSNIYLSESYHSCIMHFIIDELKPC